MASAKPHCTLTRSRQTMRPSLCKQGTRRRGCIPMPARAPSKVKCPDEDVEAVCSTTGRAFTCPPMLARTHWSWNGDCCIERPATLRIEPHIHAKDVSMDSTARFLPSRFRIAGAHQLDMHEPIDECRCLRLQGLSPRRFGHVTPTLQVSAIHRFGLFGTP